MWHKRVSECGSVAISIQRVNDGERVSTNLGENRKRLEVRLLGTRQHVFQLKSDPEIAENGGSLPFFLRTRAYIAAYWFEQDYEWNTELTAESYMVADNTWKHA